MTRSGFHDQRHRLKLLEDSGHTTPFEGRDGIEWPVPGELFYRALLTERAGRTFDALYDPFCVSRDDDRLYVFTHPGNAVR